MRSQLFLRKSWKLWILRNTHARRGSRTLKWSWAVLKSTRAGSSRLGVKMYYLFRLQIDHSGRVSCWNALVTSVCGQFSLFTFKQRSLLDRRWRRDATRSAHSGCHFGVRAYWSFFFYLFLNPNIILRRLTWPFLFTGDLFSAEVQRGSALAFL